MTVNVDPAEIRKFEALASRWWDPNSEFKPLHDINPLRLNYLCRQVDPVGLTALDVGCGGGIFAESMARLGARVTGIDLAEAPLAVARLHLLESGLDIDYRHQDAEDLARTAPASFDIVSCLEMLEHVPDPASTVRACHALVKPGGWVMFSTINRNPKAYLFAIVGAEYVLRLLPRGTHDYDKFIKPSELAGWARVAGLQLVDQIGMGYNPLTRRYALEASLDVNYIALYRRPEVSP